jgi:hypothetical protein
MTWPKNDAMPATRLTTARVLFAGLVATDPPCGATGTVVEGALCWPAIWVAG